MNGDRVGIVGPYNLSEATQLACPLADFLRQRGCRVEYLSTNQCRPGIHPFWDDRVSRKVQNFYGWASRLSLLIWFELQPGRIRLARGRCRQVFVPLWHRLPESERRALTSFDEIIAPCASLAVRMRQRLPQVRVQACDWDSGVPFAPRLPGPGTDKAVRLLVMLETLTLRDHPCGLISVLPVLLSRYPALSVTIASSGRRERVITNWLALLQQQYKARLAVSRRLGYADRLAMLQKHDWVMFATPRAESLVGPLEALSLGVPAIVYDIPPHNELIMHGHNGLKIPVRYEENWLGARTAELDVHRLLDALDPVCRDQRLLQQVRSRTWSELANHRSAFRHLWSRVLADAGGQETAADQVS